MTTDFRSLCAELADDLQEARDAVQEWANYASAYFQRKHDLQGELDRIERRIDRARNALAEPPPKPPTTMEIIELADEIEADGLGQVDLVRAALVLWGS